MTERRYPDRWRERISEAPKLLRDIAKDIDPSHPMSAVTLGLVADDMTAQAAELAQLRDDLGMEMGMRVVAVDELESLRRELWQLLDADQLSDEDVLERLRSGRAASARWPEMEQRAFEVRDTEHRMNPRGDAARYILNEEAS